MITKYHIRDMHHDCNLGNAVMDGERSAEDLQVPGIHNTIFRIDVYPIMRSVRIRLNGQSIGVGKRPRSRMLLLATRITARGLFQSMV